MPIPAPQIPAGFFELTAGDSKELNLVSGINEELFGSAVDDNVAGVLSFLRQRAGLTTLQPLFDRLNLAQNTLGERILQVIQANYTPGKIKLLLEGDEPAPLFYNKAFGRYHCTVENGFDTETQKQLEFAQLMQLKELGFNIPPSAMINAATLQKKDELIAQMEQAEQQASQMGQMQAQAEVEEAKARIELAHARATADTGLGLERVSRVEENEQLAQERKAQAHKDDTEALLAFMKALKEIESIDFGHLRELLEMQQIIKGPEKKETTAEKKAAKKPQQTGRKSL